MNYLFIWGLIKHCLCRMRRESVASAPHPTCAEPVSDGLTWDQPPHTSCLSTFLQIEMTPQSPPPPTHPESPLPDICIPFPTIRQTQHKQVVHCVRFCLAVRNESRCGLIKLPVGEKTVNKGKETVLECALK